jgi:hypothetical protein
MSGSKEILVVRLIKCKAFYILRDLYFSPTVVGDKIEKNEMGGACSSDG